MSRPEEPTCNRLLAALADADWQRWRSRLERVDLHPGQALHEPGQPPGHAYFPTSAVVSLLYLEGSGASTEFAVVGNEGMVGTALFLGGGTTNSHGAVLIAGQAWRVGAPWLREEFNRHDTVRLLLLRYTQALATQIAQTAVCNRHHAIDQQVCGWLLHSLDRLRGSDVVVTQEVLASMLGVRRESVTEAAGRLKAAGLICCTRGHIAVIDRAGLAQRSCECHAVVKREYDRLLPPPAAARPALPPRPMWPTACEAATAMRRAPVRQIATARGA